jgi:DNA-binding MltR family transcriptional regulator
MAAARSRKLLKELPSSAEMRRVLSELESQPDAQIVLMGAAYLENALYQLLRSRFIEISADEERRIFDGSGNAILGTFSSKIRISRALGLVGEKTYRDLLLFNDIRNAFAHSMHQIDFSHEAVASDIAKFSAIRDARREAGFEKTLSGPAEIICDTIWTFHAGIMLAMEPSPINRDK